jgi:hemoglobin
MKKDITDRQDIETFLESFYSTLLKDETINYIFIDVAKVDMEAHIPVIADFWESILLEKNLYRNNAMKIHVDLHGKTPLKKHHFDTWLHHFNATIDELFKGPLAERAKERALSIATMMQLRLKS